MWVWRECDMSVMWVWCVIWVWYEYDVSVIWLWCGVIWPWYDWDVVLSGCGMIWVWYELGMTGLLFDLGVQCDMAWTEWIMWCIVIWQECGMTCYSMVWACSRNVCVCYRELWLGCMAWCGIVWIGWINHTLLRCMCCVVRYNMTLWCGVVWLERIKWCMWCYDVAWFWGMVHCGMSWVYGVVLSDLLSA